MKYMNENVHQYKEHKIFEFAIGLAMNLFDSTLTEVIFAFRNRRIIVRSLGTPDRYIGKTQGTWTQSDAKPLLCA